MTKNLLLKNGMRFTLGAVVLTALMGCSGPNMASFDATDWRGLNDIPVNMPR